MLFSAIRLSPARILALAFLTIILLGTVLLTLPIASQSGHSLRFLDALFTSTSAVCVSGLVVVDTGTHFTRFGQFVIISLVQIGGLGIMTMSTVFAMILGKKIGLKERILIQESFNQFSLGGLVRLIRNVLLVTFTFEFIGGLILTIRFLSDYPPERALAFGFFHAVSAFCNAGFDLFGQVYGPFASITHYVSDWTVNLVIGGLIVLGGLGFPVVIELIKYPQTKRLSLHSKVVVKMTIMLIIIGMALILGMELTNPKTIGRLDLQGKIISSLFQSITPRTAGYNSLDISALRDGTWFLMIILMFIGTSPSSTGGGIKTTTMGVVMATVFASLKGRQDAEMFERRVSQEIVYRALTIMTMALGWVYGVTLIMSLVEPYDFIRLLFEVMSAFSTTGLTTGITPKLTDLSRILLLVTMFIGRVGILTVTLALAKFHDPGSVKYIEEKIIIG